MDTSTILILLAIGLVAGVLGGMIGIGGGIIIIPALVYFLAVDQRMAQGTSLAILLPPIGLLAVMNYYKAGQVNIKFAAVIAVAFLVGSYFGSKWALQLPVATLKKVFAGLLVLIAAKMFWGK
jgi:uncharacterized protein